MNSNSTHDNKLLKLMNFKIAQNKPKRCFLKHLTIIIANQK